MPTLKVFGLCELSTDARITDPTGKRRYAKFGVKVYRDKRYETEQEFDMFDAEYMIKNPESNIGNDLIKGTIIYIDQADLQNDVYTVANYGVQKKLKVMIRNFSIISVPKQQEQVTPINKSSNEVYFGED